MGISGLARRFCFPGLACLLPPLLRGKSLSDEDNPGGEGCGFSEDGSGMAPDAASHPGGSGMGFLRRGARFPSEKSSCSGQTPARTRGEACPYRGGRGAVASCFGGKLRHGGGQSRVLPSPSHGRWRGHGYAGVTVPCLSRGGEGVLGFGGGHTQGTSARLALARRTVSGRRRLSCARRLAWRGWAGGEPLPRCSRRDPRGQDTAVGDTEGLGFSLGRGHI